MEWLRNIQENGKLLDNREERRWAEYSERREPRRKQEVYEVELEGAEANATYSTIWPQRGVTLIQMHSVPPKTKQTLSGDCDRRRASRGSD